uniref:V-SNARE coiled-coil homology domain-containing protein n=1 Tax=viral metagenome TaxID=1070528 RepID=A0A6C0BEG9_9ZZZZ
MPSLLMFFIFNKSNIDDLNHIKIVYSEVITDHLVIKNLKTIVNKYSNNDFTFCSLGIGFYKYSVFKTDKNLFVAISETDYSTRVLKNLFDECKTKSESLKDLNKIKNITDKYTRSENVDTISKINKDLDEVKDVVSKSIIISLENNVKADKIEKDSHDLAIEAYKFRKRSKDLKNKMFWKNIKMKVIIGSIITFILILIIVISICIGGSCSSKN